MNRFVNMKKLIYILITHSLLLPISTTANENFSVEIEALTLVMERFQRESEGLSGIKKQKPSYMAFKQDECNATVEVTEKNGLQMTKMESFDVNVCKKEIYKIISN